jgi:hypothetical protein
MTRMSETTENPLYEIKGTSLGSDGRGLERTMHKHAKDNALLVGVEHPVEAGGAGYREINLYYYTTNIFRSIFPDNFPKVTRATANSEVIYSVVERINSKHKGFGEKYKSGKQEFLNEIGQIFPEDVRSKLGDPDAYMIDFRGDNPNILVNQENDKPVYVDKMEPALLRLIDKDLLKVRMGEGRKYDLVCSLIDKTIKLIEKDEEIREQLRQLDEM